MFFYEFAKSRFFSFFLILSMVGCVPSTTRPSIFGIDLPREPTQIEFKEANFQLTPTIQTSGFPANNENIYINEPTPENNSSFEQSKSNPIVPETSLVPKRSIGEATIATLEPILETPVPLANNQIVDKLGMIFIPEGEFLMGAVRNDTLASDDEKPARHVYLDSYFIDITEVTNLQFFQCFHNGGCNPGRFGFDTRDADKPVTDITWIQAVSYCIWAGKRLPTEAEWEKAARGNDERIYPWGDETDPDKKVNFTNGGLAPVGGIPSGASPYGVLDMSGNAWEWVQDFYDNDYFQSGENRNPHGPINGTQKVLKGGSWENSWDRVRISYRKALEPEKKLKSLGFRCAKSAGSND